MVCPHANFENGPVGVNCSFNAFKLSHFILSYPHFLQLSRLCYNYGLVYLLHLGDVGDMLSPGRGSFSLDLSNNLISLAEKGFCSPW